MKIVGLITEYNPFHNGHKYHIEQSKKLTGADFAIIITSGNYVQRGGISFLDKYTKTKVALNKGADIVIELPFCFATASAEFFAHAAVTILHKLNVVDYICFGSETDDISLLETAADILINEDVFFKKNLRKYLKTGHSFPVSRSMALKDELSSKYNITNTSFLDTPNNILGIEYIKALKNLKSNIKPFNLKRIVANYHEKDEHKKFYSATAIRHFYKNEDILKTLTEIDPFYMDSYKVSYPIVSNDIDTILGLSLLKHIEDNTLFDIFDINEDLANKIINNYIYYQGFDQFIELLKSKDLTYSHISRALIHILLDIKQHDMDNYMSNGICDYVRILGFKESSKPLLKLISDKSCMAMITRTGRYLEIFKDLPSMNTKMFEDNINADNLYRMITMNKYKKFIPNEFTSKLIIKKNIH